MPKDNQKTSPIILFLIIGFVALNAVGLFFDSKFSDNIFAVVFLVFFVIISIFAKKNPQKITSFFDKMAKTERIAQEKKPGLTAIIGETKTAGPSSAPALDSLFSVLNSEPASVSDSFQSESADTNRPATVASALPAIFSGLFTQTTAKKLERHKKYLQIALNGTLLEAKRIISILPKSDRIIIEAGTPLIKIYGQKAIREIGYSAPGVYLVADLKIADLAEREVAMAAAAGASAATVLGVAPIETIEEFILACQKHGLDSMIDMMNVENPLLVLRKLKTPPRVVILHRGVDETEFNKEKFIPYYQINQLKGAYNNLLLSVAGGDTNRDVQSAIFNGADIVVVWKNFMTADSTVADLAGEFLKEIK